jgi:hypothetical protein
MSHPTHNTRYSDSSHYDERCILCGTTDAPGSNGLYLPCREYRAEEIAPSDPSPTGPERAGLPVDVETVVGRVLLALDANCLDGIVIANRDVVADAVRDALAGDVVSLPDGMTIVPVEPHPHDVAYAGGMSDLSDLSANPPSREATERELKAFYRTMVSRGARRVR